MKNDRKLLYSCLMAAVATCVSVCSPAAAATVPYWFDGYDVSGPSSNINFETDSRQGGAPAPVPYVANTSDPANDYHHQLFGNPAPLQLAGDANLAQVLVSPNMDFSGVLGDQVIGKKIEVVMDAVANNLGNTFSSAAITVGSSAPLDPSSTGTDGFSVSLVEDGFVGNGNFIQIYDGSFIASNLIPNPAGAGGAFVEIFVDDPTDGNPWDGVGSTVFDVFVNGTQIDANNPANPGLSYVASAAAYTSNFITLEGNAQGDGTTTSLATHTFDNLLVSTGPAIPEPSSGLLALLLASCLGFSSRRAG